MKIVIAGSRDFTDYKVMENTLYPLFDKYGLLEDSVIISGTARGADQLGEKFAKNNDLHVLRMPADWNRTSDGSYDKSAGYKRNVDMANAADMVICFTNGSKGTGHMINIAKNKELPTFVYDFEGNLTEVYHVDENI
jgi:hypothetical protein